MLDEGAHTKVSLVSVIHVGEEIQESDKLGLVLVTHPGGEGVQPCWIHDLRSGGKITVAGEMLNEHSKRKMTKLWAVCGYDTKLSKYWWQNMPFIYHTLKISGKRDIWPPDRPKASNFNFWGKSDRAFVIKKLTKLSSNHFTNIVLADFSVLLNFSSDFFISQTPWRLKCFSLSNENIFPIFIILEFLQSSICPLPRMSIALDLKFISTCWFGLIYLNTLIRGSVLCICKGFKRGRWSKRAWVWVPWKHWYRREPLRNWKNELWALSSIEWTQTSKCCYIYSGNGD